MAMNARSSYFSMVALLSATFVLSACVSTASKKPMDVTSKTQLRDSLAPQTLKIGECGLFVWSASKTKSFILFSQKSKSSALWYNETQERLDLVSESGTPAFGQSPTNSYTRSNGDALKLELVTPQPLDDGLAYKAGTLSFKTKDGWDKVIPVVGLSACKT